MSTVNLTTDALNTANLAVSAGLPLVVAIITRRNSSPAVKQVALAVLAIATGLVTTAMEHGGTFDPLELLLGAIASYATAQGTYTLVLKPGGLATAVATVSDKAGIGATIVEATPTELATEAGATTVVNVQAGAQLTSGTVTADTITADSITTEVLGTPTGPAGLYGDDGEPGATGD